MGANGDLTSLNLFVYCGNNPILREDNGGDVWNIVAGAVIDGVVNCVSTIVSEAARGDLGWDDLAGIAVSTCIGMAEGALLAMFPGTGFVISAGASVLDTALNGWMKKKPVGEIVIDSLISGTIGAVAGSSGNGFVKGGQLLNDAAGLVGNAVRKGVHPIVKKAAKKTIRKAVRTIGRTYASEQISNLAYTGISDFSSAYARLVMQRKKAG